MKTNNLNNELRKQFNDSSQNGNEATSKEIFECNDKIVRKVLSYFDNGYLTVAGRKEEKGIRYRIAIPGDSNAADVLISNVSYKIYSYKKLNEIDGYYTGYSTRKNGDHRPYQYRIPRKDYETL